MTVLFARSFRRPARTAKGDGPAANTVSARRGTSASDSSLKRQPSGDADVAPGPP